VPDGSIPALELLHPFVKPQNLSLKPVALGFELTKASSSSSYLLLE
jgi:hypothetical protein